MSVGFRGGIRPQTKLFCNPFLLNHKPLVSIMKGVFNPNDSLLASFSIAYTLYALKVNNKKQIKFFNKIQKIFKENKKLYI